MAICNFDGSGTTTGCYRQNTGDDADVSSDSRTEEEVRALVADCIEN